MQSGKSPKVGLVLLVCVLFAPAPLLSALSDGAARTDTDAVTSPSVYTWLVVALIVALVVVNVWSQASADAADQDGVDGP